MPHKKRKIDKELSWPSNEQLSPSHPPEKARRCSPAIVPSLLSRAEKVKNLPSIIDLTVSKSSTEILAEPPLLDSEETTWFPDDLESGSKSAIRFGSCDSTLVDPAQHDDDFSRFFRSPSPDCTPTVNDRDKVAVDEHESPQFSGMSPAAANNMVQDVIDVDNLTSPSTNPDQPLDTSTGTAPKLRIRLRIRLRTKTKIKLRASEPKGSVPTKQLKARGRTHPVFHVDPLRPAQQDPLPS